MKLCVRVEQIKLNIQQFLFRVKFHFERVKTTPLKNINFSFSWILFRTFKQKLRYPFVSIKFQNKMFEKVQIFENTSITDF